MWLFGSKAWGIITQKRLRWSRGELFALLIQWQCLWHTGWHCSMLSFRLFQIGATNFAIIFSANCLIHLHAFIVCCHPLVTPKSHLSLQKQWHILDPITVLTTINLSFITPSYSTNRHISVSLVYCFFIALHCISFLVLSCIVLLYSALLFVWFFFIFSLLVTSSIKLKLKLIENLPKIIKTDLCLTKLLQK